MRRCGWTRDSLVEKMSMGDERVAYSETGDDHFFAS